MKNRWELLEQLVSEQDGKCAYCARLICAWSGMLLRDDGNYSAPEGVRLGELDHIIPRSRGGADDRDNLCASCTSCNSQKRDKTAEEYKAWKDAKREVLT